MDTNSDLKVLFLAHYAPKNENEPIPTGIMDTVYAIYHHRVYTFLKKNFPKLVSTNDISVLFDSELPYKFDYIFSLYNRLPFNNSEIFVSAVAEYHKIPYLGATPNIRALAEDKHLAKMMAKYAGIDTPKWNVYNRNEESYAANFPGPYFVKPRFGAASKYIDEHSFCQSWEEARERILYLHKNNQDAILEEFVNGTYYTSPVLNNFNKPIFLPCIKEESVLKGNIVTYEQKRKIVGGLTRTINTNPDLEIELHKNSERMYRLIQPLDYTRFDYIVDLETQKIKFLEFNVCCNLGEHSTISQSAKKLDIDYDGLLSNITYSSLYRHGLIQNMMGKQL